MFSGYFQRKTFLVTGIAGVKGSWLGAFLLRAGANVIGMDRAHPSVDSNFIASGLADQIEFVLGDVADAEPLTSLVRRVDGVFHLAAVALVRDAKQNPLDTYRSNTMGVVSVLEAIRQAPNPLRCVFVTTDKVYRPKAGDMWDEADPLVASGPYAVSKACAEYIISDYQRTYFEDSLVRIGVGRGGNVIIGGDLYTSRRTQGAGRIVPDCFEALIEGRSPEIFSPAFTRPYTYGLDILSGYMTLMSQLDRPEVAGEAFNFGPCEQYGVPNSLVATKICELWGSDINWKTGELRKEPFEFQSLAIRKSQKVLDWSPVYTLYETLRDTADWFREWARLESDLSPGSMREVNERLLSRYQKAAEQARLPWAKESLGLHV